jgi:hypothetical protein
VIGGSHEHTILRRHSVPHPEGATGREKVGRIFREFLYQAAGGKCRSCDIAAYPSLCTHLPWATWNRLESIEFIHRRILLPETTMVIVRKRRDRRKPQTEQKQHHDFPGDDDRCAKCGMIRHVWEATHAPCPGAPYTMTSAGR